MRRFLPFAALASAVASGCPRPGPGDPLSTLNGGSVAATVADLLPLVITPSGTFVPGPERSGDGRNGIGFLTENVEISSLLVTQTELTNALWTTLTGSPVPECENGWRSAGPRSVRLTCGPEWPLSDVSLAQITDLANALSRQMQFTPAYSPAGGADGDDCIRWDRGASGFRLPTMSEWEYLARAGTENRYAGTDNPDLVCSFGNIFQGRDERGARGVICGDGFYGPAPVGHFRPNEWSIQDLTGNLEEPVWAFDEGRSSEPDVWCPGDVIFVKGGAMLAPELWIPPATTQESARWNGRPNPGVGVRLVRTPG